MNGLKRFFTLILAICMVLSVVPFGAFAEEIDSSESTDVTEATVEAAETEQETDAPEETRQEDAEETEQEAAVPTGTQQVTADDTADSTEGTIAPTEAAEETVAPTQAPEETVPEETSGETVEPSLPGEYTAPGGSTVSGEPFDITISKNHRIPGLVILNDGTLVASADARWDAEQDGGGLDIVVSRSSDRGATWSYSFAAYLGDNGNVYNAASSTLIDPLLITDGTNLYLLSDLFPAGYSLGTWNTTNAFSDTGVGFDAEGRLILSNDEYTSFGYYLAGGKIYAADGTEAEGYSVDGWFNLYQDGIYVSNLFYADSPFKVRPTSYITLQTYENGAWSDPELLNVKPEGVTWQVLGPGSGIVTSDGKLAFTVYDGSGLYLVYGTGGSWHTVRTTAATNESSIVELSDGTIRAFVKNNNNTVCYVDFTKDISGYTAGELQNTGITNTGWCMVSSMKYSKLINGKEAIFVTCPSRGDGYRYDGKIHVFLLNEDNSMEWLTSYQINDAFFAYSDMVELPGGESIALLYEDGCLSYDGTAQGVGYSHISFATLPVSTIVPDAQVTAPGEDSGESTEPTEGGESTEPTEGGEETEPSETTEPTEAPEQSVTDETTNITVSAPGVTGVTVAVAEESTPAQGYDVSVTYSIDLTDADGNPYTGSATVVIPVPDELRNAASYTGSVDGTPVEVPMPVNGFFTIEMPHFSDLTISAQLQTQTIKLYKGQVYVIDDITGNYQGFASNQDPTNNCVTMSVMGDSTARLITVTDPALFTTGRKFQISNRRAGTLLTNIDNYQVSNVANWTSNYGIQLTGDPDAINSTYQWEITADGTGYAVKCGTEYLTLGAGTVSMGTAVPANPVMLTFANGYWRIWGDNLQDANDYDLYDLGNTSWDGAITCYHAGTPDEGNDWIIKEVVSASTQITFTAESAGTTTAVVGNVTYNIEVTEYLDVDVTIYEGLTETVTIDGYGYTDADASGPNDTKIATMGSVSGSFGGTVAVTGDSLEDGQYFILNDWEDKLLTNEAFTSNAASWIGTLTGLKVAGTLANATSEDLWTITTVTGGYTITRKNADGDVEYLYFNSDGDGETEYYAAMTSEETVVTLEHPDDYWRIKIDDVYLSAVASGSHDGAFGYNADATDGGNNWEIYRIADASTSVTFAGVEAGKTTAIVGHVRYNITVLDSEPGDISGFDNIVGVDTYASAKDHVEDMAGRTINYLTITNNSTFHLGVDVTDYDAISWSVADTSIATVDADGNVTGKTAGTTTVTATVVKNGVRESKTIELTVKSALANEGESTIPMFFYIEELQNTTPYYTFYLGRSDAADAADGFKLQAVREGEVLFIERPVGVFFGSVWTAAPDDGYALAYMGSAGSDDQYQPLKNANGNLGGTGQAGDEDNTDYFCEKTVYTGILNNGNWDSNVTAMLESAIKDPYDCEGGQGFTRGSGASDPLATSMSFKSEPLPEVSKVVNGILPTTYLRKDFRLYTEGMVATVDELIYYTITVTIPRPTVWQKDSPTLGAIIYTDALLTDVIDNEGNGEAYFYIQKLDTNNNGILDDSEIASADVDGDGTLGDDLTQMYITDDLNEAWGADETSRTLSYFVVYRIQQEDIPGNTIKNTVNFNYSYKTSYSSGSYGGTAEDNAVITVIGSPIDDIVIDFGLPVTFTGLTKEHGVDLMDSYTSTYNSAIVRSDPYTQTDENGDVIKDNYGNIIYYYDLTYTPTQILQGPDVVTLIRKNADGTDKIVNGFIVYPATTVFYEEGFAAFPTKKVNGSDVPGFEGGSRGSVTQEVQIIANGDTNYGYNSAYIRNYKESSGDAATSDQGNDRATFQFTGTGVDVYANCTPDSGDVLLQIRNHDTNKLVKFSRIMTKTGTGDTAATAMQVGDHYSLPIYSVTDLPFGTYDVVIQHSGLASGAPVVSLDGFRVYNTLYNATNVSFYATNEQNPTFVELRDYILAAYDVNQVKDSSQYKTASNTIIEMVYDQDERGTGVFLLSNLEVTGTESADDLLIDLLDNGPKNEIYLGPGMSVTFTLNDGVSAQIGLKSIKGAMATCTINGSEHNIQSSIDMFYDIANGAGDLVEIKNTGTEGVLSITKLKVFGNVGLDDIFKPVTPANVSFSLLRMAPIISLDEPVITRQPVDTTAALNEDMAVSLSAEGENLSYQWYWRNASDEEFQVSSCRTDTYYTTMTKARDGRQIYCVITDAQGNQATSDTVTLSRVASSGLRIVTQPVSARAVLNEDMAVSLKASGESLKYQWYWRNAGQEEFQKSSCRTDTYYTTMTKVRDGREIYCVVTDAVGNQVVSRTVTLRRIATAKLAIVSQPVNASAVLNEDMAVSLTAEGEGLKYQWYWRNAGAEEFLKSSCRTDTYYTTMTKVRDGREIYCVITDDLGNQATSNTVTLRRVAAAALQITTQPVDATAVLNEDMAVSLTAEGEGLKYQWYWRNAGAEEFQKSSCRTDTYYTTMTKVRDGREIYCVITDALGDQIVSDTVTIRRVAETQLQILQQPVNASAALNEQMAVSLAAEGEGLKYQWYWRNAVDEEFQKSSCRTDTYCTTMTKVRDGREIYCVITDDLGNQVISEVVTLTMDR